MKRDKQFNKTIEEFIYDIIDLKLAAKKLKLNIILSTTNSTF